ncbi:hypothetical protein EPUS_03515 [Endocarpon pusillum Z07020]|uniref:MARVEL domain-containing protein n=1 Tax=Endocarpon pusillum (strain Z07020 / HMAS-L-300199) TaxID=1263415 RepID=U1HM41_ENDPU|nr:uncharacterized protein EPUS_03515 [Endocarpon pusillum Z07020]ERF71360.1 hypothetical protein EPUS_03515 [Endocarpon pusillum Z07020]
MPTSPYAQPKGFPDVHYLPVTHQAQDGSHNSGLSMEAGYPSPNFSSPGFSSQASPGPFKSLEEVRSFHEMKQEDAIMKHRIRLLKFILRLATLLLALYMIATMSLTFRKYFNTRHIIIDVPGPTGPRGPWAGQTKTWPTTVLLVTSTLSFIISAVVMASYVRGVHAANAAHEYGSYLGFGIFAAHVGMWIAVAVAYRTGKDGNDLWGWTCDERAMNIQKAFERVINFKRYCDIQTSSWITSVAQAVLMVFGIQLKALSTIHVVSDLHDETDDEMGHLRRRYRDLVVRLHSRRPSRTCRIVGSTGTLRELEPALRVELVVSHPQEMRDARWVVRCCQS